MITPHHDPYSRIFQPNRFRRFVNKYQNREWDKSVLTRFFQKNFPISPGGYMRQSSLIIKLQVVEPQILRIKDSTLSVFLIILRVFKNLIFFGRSVGFANIITLKKCTDIISFHATALFLNPPKISGNH